MIVIASPGPKPGMGGGGIEEACDLPPESKGGGMGIFPTFEENMGGGGGGGTVEEGNGGGGGGGGPLVVDDVGAFVATLIGLITIEPSITL